MDTELKFVIGFLAAFLLFVVVLVVGSTASDTTDWTPDERGCYVRTYHDNRVFWNQDKASTTIKTYCPEGK